MLLNNFFIISQLNTVGSEVNATLAINSSHEIFNGHFPGKPVVPGVCMMQMVKEILENVTGNKIDLLQAQEMKFLAIIDPTENHIIEANIKYKIVDDAGINVTSTLFKDELIHFKFKGYFSFRTRNEMNSNLVG